MQIYQEMISPKNFGILDELISWEWDDYDDFMRKYGAEFNRDAFSKRYSTWYRFNGIGLLVKDGLIDVDRVYELMSEVILWQWEKFGAIIKKSRVIWKVPNCLEGFEYVADEMMNERMRRGNPTEFPERLGKYISTDGAK